MGFFVNSKGSKSKGSNFERLLCRKLSLLVTNGKNTDCFWRSAMSGGRARIQLNKDIVNTTQSGDISSISEQGFWLINNYTIEAKHYADLQLASGFLSNTGTLYEFWRKLVNDCRITNKRPLMIAKQNNRPIIMLTLPGRAPTHVLPIITLHEWPAELRLLESLEQLTNVSDHNGGHPLERQPTRRVTLGSP